MLVRRVRRSSWRKWSGPWAAICALIEPHYPKPGNGRPPIGLERMLRMYCVAHWFNLADEACEEALYDIALFRDFCGCAATRAASTATALTGARNSVSG